MDLNTLYNWITSFLRPRGDQYKSRTSSNNTTTTPSSSSTEATTTLKEERIVNCVELIPTLNFIIKTDIEEVHEEGANAVAQQQQQQQHAVVATIPTTTTTYCQHKQEQQDQVWNLEEYNITTTTTTNDNNNQVYAELRQAHYNDNNDNDNDNDDDKHSSHTYVIESGETSLLDNDSDSVEHAEGLSGLIELSDEQQEIDFSLRQDTSDDASFLVCDEPTSSISLSNMEDKSGDKSAIRASTTRSNNSSIEEEIEEALELSVTTTTNQTKSSSSSDKHELPLKPTNEMFGIELSDNDGDDGDNEKQDNSNNGAKSVGNERFNIDDEQLSGGHLAQHFIIDEDAKHANEEKNSSNEIEEESLTNQSTTNDVSDLLDEASHELPKETKITSTRESPVHGEKDNSVEEIMASNQSIEMTNISSVNHSYLEHNATLINQLLADSSEAQSEEINSSKMITDLDESDAKAQPGSHMTALSIDVIEQDQVQAHEDEDDDDVDNSLKLMKLRIMAMKHQTVQSGLELQLSPHDSSETKPPASLGVSEPHIRPMERVSISEFTKEVLEDITEESERNSLSVLEVQSISREPTAVDATSENIMVPAKLLQRLEHKIIDLQSIMHSKDACLAALNMQLEAAMQRRESGSGEMGSARDTSSLVTNSTEYRTLQEDLPLVATGEIYMELSKRDELIAKLTDSLQQSVNMREQLQLDSDKLAGEVQQLRKQLFEAMDSMRRTVWPRYQESNGQRISEISMDLISESDDGDMERHFLTDNEEKFSRNSRERQFSLPRQYEVMLTDVSMHEQPAPFNKQIEQFQKYLTPSEVRLFFMVQKKFDDFLSQELEKAKMKIEQEHRVVVEQLEMEKRAKQEEVQKLLEQRQQTDLQHSKEMEDLRKYFENKCADLEKQFSDDVFSQKSQHHAGDTSSDNSDNEPLVEEVSAPRRLLYKSLSREIAISTGSASANTSPRKRSRAELLLSPSHRQMTPSTDAFVDNEACVEVAELRSFYQNKLRDYQRISEENMRKISTRLKYYESRYPHEEFMITANVEVEPIDNEPTAMACDEKNEEIPMQNTSLIIIDQDELQQHDDESQVIQKIIEEYERRLQEQLELARADIEGELVKRIQTLSEGNVDDQHWPSSLILLREKFTAKSQLEIAQLQMKHEEEMSRLKLEHEKQLKRKNLRNTTFDSARSIDNVLSERNSLRELSRTLRYTLSQLAHCVLGYEDDLNNTILEEVQRVLTTAADQSVNNQLANVSSALLNSSLNASMDHVRRMAPDVQNLLQLVDGPRLVEYVDQNNFTSHSLTLENDVDEDFDLQDCLRQLRSEADKLLSLSCKLQANDKLKLRHGSESSLSSGTEKHDSGAEKSPSDNCETPVAKMQRAHSLNETPDEPAHHKLVPLQIHSLPHDLQKYAVVSGSGTPTTVSSAVTSGENASELNLQLHELKNRLVKSEQDRAQLQQQLENTISRNTELGQQLQNLRDQFSQLNSLNAIEYAQGYGMGSLKSAVERLSSVADKLGGSVDNSDGTLSPTSSFVLLQEKARQLLNITPTSEDADITIKSPEQQQNLQQVSQQSLDQSQQQSLSSSKRSSDATVILLQMIEDFCREGDEIVEHNKKDRYNLQAQIDNADKQLKATRQFLEDQAAEREQERDEYLCEIQQLNLQLRDKDKELGSYRNTSEEVEQLEQQIKELTENVNLSETKREQMEVDLKASIDKIVMLRDIIASLETQVDQKTLEENLLQQKVQELEGYLSEQLHANNVMQCEVQTMKHEISNVYEQRINALEEKLQNVRPASEQSIMLQQVADQLADIERALVDKIQTLESLHHAISSNSCSISATEDVSVASNKPTNTHVAMRDISSPEAQGSPVHPSPRQHSISMEAVQRVADKLAKHTRVEEAAIKRIRDLEMQIKQMREFYGDIQQERDALQERMHEQTQRISSLQMRLEEQRQRAEQIQRTGNSDLSIRVHDLTEEVKNLRELLDSRDKQIATLKQQLDKSKQAIDRLEAELQVEQHPDRSLVERLEQELKQKDGELQSFKERMKSQMINKLALPDLMETMLADKNEEIDHLKEKLDAKEKQLQQYMMDVSQADSGAGDNGAKPVVPESSKLSARTLSDIVSISEFDEPEMVRRAALPQQITPLLAPQLNVDRSLDMSKNMGGHLRPAHTFEHPHYFQDAQLYVTSDHSTPALMPRQIHFSAFSEDSKIKTPQQAELSKAEQALEEAKTRQNDLEAEVEHLRGEVERLQLAEQKAVQQLDTEIRSKDEKLLILSIRVSAAEQQAEAAHAQIQSLEAEIERLRVQQQQQPQNSDNSSRQFSVDEIARQVEKELNYSVQLDTNILKAIESEEENNLDKQMAATGTDDENFTGERELLNQLAVLRAQIIMERERCEEMRAALLSEQQHSHEIQEQDVNIIETLRERLETALQDKDTLMQQLDGERERVERLQTQITSWQRVESRRSSAASVKSPVESPRRNARLQQENIEAMERLRAEIKLLTAQNEREQERLEDLQRAQERERVRFVRELKERQEYSEIMQKKQTQLLTEKQSAEECVEHLQERLTLQTQEIESLEARIAALQEAETRRSMRREKLQRENGQLLATLQQMKTAQTVAENDQQQLRFELERAVVREQAMAEALSTAQQNMLNGGGTRTMPVKIVQDLERINSLLEWNTRENMKMSDKVQDLVEDREHLQRERDELRAAAGANVTELEERCQHLFGRYRRVESHRKALVYQKRYLKISLDSYKEKLAILTGAVENAQETQVPVPRNTKKLFKTVAIAIIAIKRMKFIVHLWQTGKRTVLKSIVTITQQKRLQPPPVTQNQHNGMMAVTPTTPTNTLSSDENNYNNIINNNVNKTDKLQQFYVLTKNNNNNDNIDKKNFHLLLDYPLTTLDTPTAINHTTNDNEANLEQLAIDGTDSH